MTLSRKTRSWNAASDVVYAYPQADIKRGPAASAIAYAHHLVAIELDLLSSHLACAQWIVDVKHGLLASIEYYTFLSRSTVDSLHRFMPANDD